MPITISPRQNVFLRTCLIAAVYFAISEFGGIWGWRALYPIRLFVTFLHEFGHGFGTIISGGSIEYIQIDPNAGGLTLSLGGVRPITIMGGYIGSALFGNILFYIGAARPKWVKPTLIIVIAIMLVTGFIWTNSIFTTVVMVVFSALLFLIGFKTKLGRDALMLIGLASIIYILQDTHIGPSSDLRAMETEMRFIPAKLWMYIWLAIALGLLAFNLRMLFRREKKTIERIKKPLN